jgi:2-polyprenyl-6-methoxyphenol hydroxylase-like FAD-dependent oxidoreductase
VIIDSCDIAIVGAGFTGALAAAALADGRRRIVVLDARPAGRPQFGGELIHAAGIDMLVGLGLWHVIEGADGERVDGFRVTAGPEDEPVALPYRDVPALRPGGLSLEHHEIVARVRAYLARRPGVEVRTGQRVIEFLRKDGRVAGVRTARGDDLHAPLTLIADGRHSRLRKTLGIRARQRAVSLSAIARAANESLPTRGYAHIALGGPGPALAYGLHNRDVRFCIDVPLARNITREAVASQLREQYAGMLPDPFRRQLLRALDGGSIELCGNYMVQTDRCTVSGAALIGDAGGCSHPLTASGMTNSLSDIRILSEELRMAETVDQALARYEVRRYRFVRIREILAEELYEAFRAQDAGHGRFEPASCATGGRAPAAARPPLRSCLATTRG